MAKTINSEYKYWIKQIKKSADAVSLAPYHLKLDRNFAIACCQENGKCLRYFTDFQNDKVVVLSAVKNDGMAVEFADVELRDDGDVANLAVESNGLSLQFLSDFKKFDRDLVLRAIKSAPDAHKHDLLEDDKEIVIACLKAGATLSDYKEFWNDRDVILASERSLYDDAKAIYSELSHELKTDKEIVKLFIKESSDGIFDLIPEEILKDKEILKVYFELKNEISDFIQLPQSLKGDKEFLLEAVKYNPEIYKILPVEIRAEKEFYELAILKLGLIDELPDFVFDDEEMILNTKVEIDRYLLIASDRLKKEKSFVRKTCEIAGMNFQYADETIKDDKDFVLELIDRICPDAFKYVSKRLRDDRDIVVAAIQSNPICYKHASKRLREDKVILDLFYKPLIKMCYPEMIKYVPEKLRTDPDIIKLIPVGERNRYWG